MLFNNALLGAAKNCFYIFRSLFFSAMQSASFVLSRRRGMALSLNPAAQDGACGAGHFRSSAQSDLRICSFLSSLGKKETYGGRASPAEESD